MTSERALGRWTGAVYLLVVVTGIFCLGHVPGQINVPGQPVQTLANIVAHQRLFQAGIAAFLVEQVAFLLLPLMLFRLLGHQHRWVVVSMVALAVAAVPIALVAVGHRLDALAVLTDPHFGVLADPRLTQVLALQSLKAYAHGIAVASLFWGLWLLPFGYLVFKSGQLPKILGVLLMLGGAGYQIDVFGPLLVPGYDTTALSDHATLPASIGEIGTCLWLLVFGMRRRDQVSR